MTDADLNALALVCTLSPSPAESSSQLLAQPVLDELSKDGVDGSLIRAVDHDHPRRQRRPPRPATEDDPLPAKADQEGKSMSKNLSSTKNRKKLSKKSFALPGKRKYPIPDKAHARNALARVAQNGTPAEQKKVKAAVKRRFPSIGKTKS
jgi:hypothetical protein